MTRRPRWPVAVAMLGLGAALLVVSSALGPAPAGAGADAASPGVQQAAELERTNAARVCLPSDVGGERSVWVSATPAPGITPGTSSVTVGPLGQEGPSSVPPGSLGGPRAPADTAVLVAAQGPAATGLMAEQRLLVSALASSGLARARCAEPGAAAWFPVGDGIVGHRTELILANPAASPAMVDVAVFDGQGEVPAPATTDLGIAPSAARVVAIDPLVAGSEVAGVQVSVEQGQVVAGVLVREVDGLDPAGLSWLDPSIAAAAEATLLSLPAGTTGRVRLMNPSTQDAVAALTLLGPDGPLAEDPGATDELVVPVPAGAVVERVLLDGAALKAPTAVRVAADVPLVVSARADSGASGAASDLPDFAWMGVAQPLTGPTVTVLVATPQPAERVPKNAEGRSAKRQQPAQAIPGGAFGRLTLLATEGAQVAVELAVLAETGEVLLSESVQVAGDRLLDVDLTDLLVRSGATTRARPAMLRLTPSEPGLVAAALTSTGGVRAPGRVREEKPREADVLDVLVLATPSATLPVVAVREDLRVGLPPWTAQSGAR